MRTALVLLGLVGFAAGAGSLRYRELSRVSRGDSDTTTPVDAGAFLEIATAPGLGLGEPCAGGTVTGTDGETLTFTRSVSSMCTKGHPFTNIQEGDLVLLGANVPRVSKPDGVNKQLAVDPTATNLHLRSDDLSSAYYTWSATGGVAVPVRTQNAATAPDLGVTADRVQFDATNTSGKNSQCDVTVAGAGGTGTPFTCSVYLRGRSGSSGTMDFCLWAGGAWECAACAFISTGYNRCVKTYSSTVGSSRATKFGNLTGYNGGVSRVASDVDLVGWQCEENSYATAYIATTASGVTRSGVETLRHTLADQLGGTGSVAVSFTPLHTGQPAPCGGNCGGPNAWTTTGNGRLLYGNLTLVRAYDGTNNPGVTANHVQLTQKRYCSRWSTAGGWVLKNVTDALTQTSAFTVGTFATTATGLGFLSEAGITPGGYVNNICFSRSEECCP